jgi:hypothetical protein
MGSVILGIEPWESNWRQDDAGEEGEYVVGAVEAL